MRVSSLYCKQPNALELYAYVLSCYCLYREREIGKGEICGNSNRAILKHNANEVLDTDEISMKLFSQIIYGIAHQGHNTHNIISEVQKAKYNMPMCVSPVSRPVISVIYSSESPQH